MATQQLARNFVAPFVNMRGPQPIDIVSVAFSPDQNLLLVAYHTPPRPPLGNPVIAYRLSDGAIAWKYEQQPTLGQPLIRTPLVTIKSRNEIAFGTRESNNDSERFARIVILNAESGAFLRSIDRIHVDGPTTLAVSADGQRFATATNTGDVQQSLNMKDNHAR
jgi:hypothetical protein